MALLDLTKVPPTLHCLIPLAMEWGISDDYDREEKVSQATTAELRALVSSIDNISDEDLYGWLEGPESYSDTPSNEYVVFTCFTIAIDSAKVKMKKRSANT